MGSPFFRIKRNSSAALFALFFIGLVYLWIAIRAENPAGGQDSWNHYLYARWSVKHPLLLLDLWGKPFFTVLAMPLAQLGINAVYVLNVLATLGTAWICYLTGRKLALRNPWLLIILFGFQPVVTANVFSALTEPTNALVLAYVIYLFVSDRYVLGFFCASFLPIIRTEGIVILFSLIPFVWLKRQLSKLPLLFSGTFIYAIFAGFVSGKWNYFIVENPYFKHESSGKFDPGSGEFMHYIQNHQHITGVWVSILLVGAWLLILKYGLGRIRKKTPDEMSQFALWLLWPVFLGYFLAHSTIWYLGAMGSHGLIRVFFVVSPVVAILAHFVIHRLMNLDISLLTRGTKIVTVLGCFMLTFPGAGLPYPWQNKPVIPAYPGKPQLLSALQYIQSQHLDKQILVHQFPEINVWQNLDPFVTGSDLSKYHTFYIWSIDTREGQDWMPDSTVVIWDNFHARRDGPMPLNSLRNIVHYQELKYFPSSVDTIYDVRVFLKVLKSN